MKEYAVRKCDKVDWSKFNHLLGVMMDKDIAKVAGCTATNVSYHRRSLNIAPVITNRHSPEEKAFFSELKLQGKSQCQKCKTVKPLSAFDRDGENTNVWCKICKQIYYSKRVEAKRSYWLEKAGAACQNCKFSRWVQCLDFHHVNEAEKDWSPSKLLVSRLDEPSIFKELDKCAILCSNCHQAVHRGAIELVFIKRDGLGWTVENPV